jgi:predicted Zn-dependent protease
VAYLMQSDFGKAEAVLRPLIQSEPGDDLAQRLLSDCYNRWQKWTQLRESARALRRIAPRDANGWYYGAQAEYQLLETGEAPASKDTLRQYARRASELAPGDWRAQVLAGKLLLRDHRPRDAVASFRKAVAANPDEPTTHYLLGTTLRQLGDEPDSQREFERFRQAREQEKARRFRTLVVDIQNRDSYGGTAAPSVAR